MSLKCVKKVVFEIDYSDLEQFVRETYGCRDYSFVATEECGNDSVHSFYVDANLSKYDKEEADAIRKGGHPKSNGVLLETLCVDGHIERGKYIVEVCW